jgi:hypothetical protein
MGYAACRFFFPYFFGSSDFTGLTFRLTGNLAALSSRSYLWATLRDE